MQNWRTIDTFDELNTFQNQFQELSAFAQVEIRKQMAQYLAEYKDTYEDLKSRQVENSQRADEPHKPLRKPRGRRPRNPRPLYSDR